MHERGGAAVVGEKPPSCADLPPQDHSRHAGPQAELARKLPLPVPNGDIAKAWNTRDLAWRVGADAAAAACAGVLVAPVITLIDR